MSMIPFIALALFVQWTKFATVTAVDDDGYCVVSAEAVRVAAFRLLTYRVA